MSHPEAQLERWTRAGAARLLARAAEARSLDESAVATRLRGALEKYLLRDEPDAPLAKIEKFLDELHADDLCLALACERSDERAWADLIERFGTTVRSAARGASSSAEAAEELAQSIWAELYGLRAREGGAASGKLAHYSGRGSLGGWLRAVVGQLAIDRHRQVSRLVQMESEADGDRSALEQREKSALTLVATTDDPERTLSESRATSDLHAALAAAIAGLEDEDRLLIRLYYFDNLRLREAGAVLGVHEATASRRLSNLHKEIRRRVQKILTEERGWTTAEVKDSLSATASRFDGDLGRLLSPETVPEKTGAQSGKSVS